MDAVAADAGGNSQDAEPDEPQRRQVRRLEERNVGAPRARDRDALPVESDGEGGAATATDRVVKAGFQGRVFIAQSDPIVGRERKRKEPPGSCRKPGGSLPGAESSPALPDN
jgi:hypothetical protein